MSKTLVSYLNLATKLCNKRTHLGDSGSIPYYTRPSKFLPRENNLQKTSHPLSYQTI
jgi:hypothetical protein